MTTLRYENEFNKYLKSGNSDYAKDIANKINLDIQNIDDDVVIHLSSEYYLYYIKKDKLIKSCKVYRLYGNPIYDYDILKENTIYLCLIDIYYEIQGVVF